MARSVPLQKIFASSLAMPGSMPVLLAVQEAVGVLEVESSSGTVAVGGTICCISSQFMYGGFGIAVMVGPSEVAPTGAAIPKPD